MCCGTFDVVMFDVVKSLARRRSRVRVTVCRRTSLLYMMRVYESELACCECGVLGLHLRECLKNMKGSFVYSVQAHPHRTTHGYFTSALNTLSRCSFLKHGIFSRAYALFTRIHFAVAIFTL